MVVLYLNRINFVVFLQLGHPSRLRKTLNLECQFFPAFNIQIYSDKNVLPSPKEGNFHQCIAEFYHQVLFEHIPVSVRGFVLWSFGFLPLPQFY